MKNKLQETKKIMDIKKLDVEEKKLELLIDNLDSKKVNQLQSNNEKKSIKINGIGN